MRTSSFGRSGAALVWVIAPFACGSRTQLDVPDVRDVAADASETNDAPLKTCHASGGSWNAAVCSSWVYCDDDPKETGCIIPAYHSIECSCGFGEPPTNKCTCYASSSCGNVGTETVTLTPDDCVCSTFETTEEIPQTIVDACGF